MRFIDLALILTVFFPLNLFSQQEEENLRPNSVSGGLVKRLEKFREKIKQDRVELPSETGKIRLEVVNPQEDFGPQLLEFSRSSRRNPDQKAVPQQVLQIAPVSLASRIQVKLGLKLRPGIIGTPGLVVDQVEKASPAELAGLQRNDRILSIGGSPVKKIGDFNVILAAFEPGDRTELELVRSGKKSKVLVKFPVIVQSPATPVKPPILPLAQESSKKLLQKPERRLDRPAVPSIVPMIQRPVAEVRAGIGVTAVAVDPALFEEHHLSVRQGAYLDAINRGSAAEKAGLTVGDVVIAVDGRKVDSAVRMAVLIQAYQPGDKAQVLYYRDKHLKRTEIQMDATARPVASNGNLLPVGDTTLERKSTRNSILGDLGKDFPRLKKVEELIDRFAGGAKSGERSTASEMTGAQREIELENEIRRLREQLKRQEQEIKDLTERIKLIERPLRKSK
ncbi:MAG: PDZ domain-containing protein [Planctomycetota bacterium]|nr:PDZ domain-containing protein [Planctomycetota bacterium]